MSETPLVRLGTTQKLQQLHWLKKLHEDYFWAKPFCSCCGDAMLKELAESVSMHGEDEEADKKVEGHDYSIIHGLYKSDSETVELEYTSGKHVQGQCVEAYSEEEQKTRHEKAYARLEAFYVPVFPLGVTMYILVLGGGFLGGYVGDCSEGPAIWSWIFVAVAIVLQLYVLEKLTVLISQTELEGREMLRLLTSLKCVDNYRFVLFLACVDTFSRFTRAQFVGYIAHCNEEVEDAYDQLFKHYGKRHWFDHLARYMGISGVAVASFIVGPVCMGMLYALRWRKALVQEFETHKRMTPGENMKVADSMDELSGLMSWAGLEPAARVFDLASIPINLDEYDDVDRLWGRMKLKVRVALAKNIPDGILQLNMQAWFFALAFTALDTDSRYMMFVNVFCACIGTILDSVDLLLANRRGSVCAALFMLYLCFTGLNRVAACFYCPSHIHAPHSFPDFACVPEGLVTLPANLTIAVLPA
eukprot:TRINITY_DN15647_c0_g1_i1.p1 TRINITY_DN15647_c0_g1~~TRINITY_DN15647_c0_g1_i1.p1  ORF type:complete len:473 (-),score=84.95 TRINITY_DN15647_c0_g1_i1:188-1606(-)